MCYNLWYYGNVHGDMNVLFTKKTEEVQAAAKRWEFVKLLHGIRLFLLFALGIEFVFIYLYLYYRTILVFIFNNYQGCVSLLSLWRGGLKSFPWDLVKSIPVIRCDVCDQIYYYYYIRGCTHGIPHMHYDIPRRTEHPPMYSRYPPMYSWYPSDLLNLSLPNVLMVPPYVLNTPPPPPPTYSWYSPMYSWYPPMYSWYPPNVLNTPRCTEHPPMYWTHIIQGGSAVSDWKFEWLHSMLYIKTQHALKCLIWSSNNLYVYVFTSSYLSNIKIYQ